MTEPTLTHFIVTRLAGSSRANRIRRASARLSLIAAVLIAAFTVVIYRYAGTESRSTLSPEEQQLFQLPASPRTASSQPSSTASKTDSDTVVWLFPTKAIELSTADLQSRCTEQVEQLIREFPDNVEANHIAARVYFFLRQPEKAEPFWRKCLQIGPRSAAYYCGLGMILEERGQPDEVQKLIEQAHSDGLRTAETNVRLIKAMEALGQVELARTEVSNAVQDYPDSHELWQIQGQILNQLGRFEEAEQSFRKSLELGGSSERILPSLVLSLARQKKIAEAAEVKKQFSRENVPSGQDDKREGDYQRYYDSNLRQLAIAVYQTAARVFAQNRRLNEYRTALRQCIELNPSDSEAIIALAEVAKSLQQLDVAKDLLQRATQANPEDVNCYMSLANLAMKLDDKTLAESTLLQAVQLPNGFVAQHSLAQMYLLQGRQSEALKHAEQVIERDQSIEAYLLHSFICSSVGQRQAAQESLEKARKIAPEDPRVQAMKLP